MNLAVSNRPRSDRKLLPWAASFAIAALGALLSFGCLSHSSEPKTNGYLDDKVIAARVIQLLHSQPDYKYPDIQVAVTNGTVYLSGSVQTPDQRLRLAGLTQQVENVRSIKFNLAVVNH